MKLLGAVSRAALLLVCAVLASGQASAQSPAPSECPDAISPVPSERARALSSIPVLRDADETAWIANTTYYTPLDRQARDIDVESLQVTRAWHFSNGWEAQLDGVVLRAQGTRTLPTNPPTLQRSDAFGAGFGVGVRWNFLQFDRVRFLGDLSPALIFTNNNFPAGGRQHNFFLRAGAGAAFRVTDSYWLEAGFFWTHISNGEFGSPRDPTWQGEGVSLSLRHADKKAPVEEKKGKGLPILRDADENAWVTGAEYLAPLSFSNRLDPGLNVKDYRVARAWHFANGLEFQFGGLVFPSNMASGLGPLVRWNFLEPGRWRFFAEAEPNIIKTSFFFAPTNDPAHVFLRAGAGVSYRLRKSYRLEASYRLGHTLGDLNGRSVYSSFSGHGPSLTLRHTFG